MKGMSRISNEPYIIGVLVVVIVWSIHQIYIASKLSKHPVIIKLVNSLSKEELQNNQVTRDQIYGVGLTLSKVGQKYGYWTIRQAITFAVTKKISGHKEKGIISIEELDIMSGTEFESFLKQFFINEGYKVLLTPGSGDQGVDLILIKDYRKIAIQAKRYLPTNRVSNLAIQEVNTGMKFYDCTESYVITTSYFTNPAIILANKVGVKLIDRDRLVHMLKGNAKL